MRGRTSLLIVSLLGIAVLVASQEPCWAPGGPKASPLSKDYGAWWNSHPSEREHTVVAQRPKEAEKITEIALLRINVSSDPGWEVHLFPDGRVEYTGYANVDHIGCWTGSVHPQDFRRLAELAIEMKIPEMRTAYTSWVTDHAAYLLRLEWKDGHHKLVLDYAESAPRRMWAFELAVEKTVSRIRWDAAPPQSTPSATREGN